MYRYLLLLGIVVFSGCAIVPESIDVPEGTQLVTYSKAVTAGANAQGQQARWGGIIAGVANNNSADAPGNGGTDPVQPTCEGDDPLVDGVCVGTTNTVTVTTSGTSTVTKTITVPVTFTYAPTVQ